MAQGERRRWAPGVIVALAVTFAIVASVARAFGVAPLGTGDETGHLDYAYELWHHRLPSWAAGVIVKPSWATVPPVQWEAQHPPLFYAIVAPVVGPLVDDGHVYRAVIAGRLVNCLLAGVAVLASWWAARRLAPGHALFAALATLIVAANPLLVSIGGTLYSDLPCLIFSALAVGVIATLWRRGSSPGMVTLAAVIGAGGMLSRLSFVLVLAGLLVALFFSADGHAGLRHWARRVRDVAIVVVAAAAASGWFYLHNLRATGNFSGSHPDYAATHLGRSSVGWIQALVDPEVNYWTGLWALFDPGKPPGGFWPWLLLLVPLVLFVVVALVQLVRSRPSAAIAGSVASYAVIVVATALAVLDFVVGLGGANTRYSLPLLPIAAVAFAWMFLKLRVPGAILATAWLLGELAMVATQVGFTPTALDPAAPQIARAALAAATILLVAALIVLWVGRRAHRPGTFELPPRPAAARVG
jgi:hypothetical protein